MINFKDKSTQIKMTAYFLWLHKIAAELYCDRAIENIEIRDKLLEINKWLKEQMK